MNVRNQTEKVCYLQEEPHLIEYIYWDKKQKWICLKKKKDISVHFPRSSIPIQSSTPQPVAQSVHPLHPSLPGHKKIPNVKAAELGTFLHPTKKKKMCITSIISLLYSNRPNGTQNQITHIFTHPAFKDIGRDLVLSFQCMSPQGGS